MHKDLVRMFDRLIEKLKTDERVKGGWHHGSLSRNTQDAYSDYDAVFLTDGEDFQPFIKDLPGLLENVCDELLIFWAEDFNDDQFQNHCCVVRLGENLHQFDIFIVNGADPDNFMTRLHSTVSSMESIIFDRNGETAAFLKASEEIIPTPGDPVRLMDTYWFHVQMLVKYFKRRDLFKLLKNVDILFHAHVDLLLFGHDSTDWGGWESKVKHSLSAEKQENLKAYFTRANFDEIEQMMRRSITVFRKDAREICKMKDIAYREDLPEKVSGYFVRRMDCQDEEEAGWV